MNNIPQVKLGIVAVSRDCFPESLSVNRRKALVAAYAPIFNANADFPIAGLAAININSEP